MRCILRVFCNRIRFEFQMRPVEAYKVKTYRNKKKKNNMPSIRLHIYLLMQ